MNFKSIVLKTYIYSNLNIRRIFQDFKSTVCTVCTVCTVLYQAWLLGFVQKIMSEKTFLKIIGNIFFTASPVLMPV